MNERSDCAPSPPRPFASSCFAQPQTDADAAAADADADAAFIVACRDLCQSVFVGFWKSTVLQKTTTFTSVQCVDE